MFALYDNYCDNLSVDHTKSIISFLFMESRLNSCFFWAYRAGQNTFHENENVTKYEIMDGAPVRGTISAAAKHHAD